MLKEPRRIRWTAAHPSPRSTTHQPRAVLVLHLCTYSTRIPFSRPGGAHLAGSHLRSTVERPPLGGGAPAVTGVARTWLRGLLWVATPSSSR